ncbi:hypothetical protein JCM18237_20470 [Halorubrum luteum]
MERTRRDLLAATRRALVGTGVGAAAGVAGCLDFTAGDGPQGPAGTPAELTCPDAEFVRLDTPFEGPVDDRTTATPVTTVELSTEGTSETYGSTLRLALRNTGTAPATTLGEHAYAIQRDTGRGWQEVRGSLGGPPVDLPRTEESLSPNGGYTWTFRLRETDLSEAVPEVDLDVCPPLGAGTHRFVYWGIEDASPVGIEFELIG